jgi:acyl carrier protein
MALIVHGKGAIMTNRAEITEKLVEFLESDTEVRLDNLSDGLSLREGLGLDSVDLVGIIMRIEGHYRIRLSHAELEKVETVGNLLDLIETKVAENSAGVIQPKAA